MSGEAIRLEGVFAGYGGADIVRDASLEAPGTGVTAIAGPNGAGKSTLMKTVVGLLRPRAGRVLLGERDLTPLDPPERAAAGLGYVPQEHNVFKNLTIGENLQIGFEFIRRRGTSREFAAARERVFRLFPELTSRLKHLAGTLSGGQRQMLAIGCALMPQPRALLLDEPSAGLSPRNVGLMLEAVQRVNRSGVTVLMIEQNLVEAVRVSDGVVLLVAGEVRGRWPADRFLEDPEVRRLFLAGTEEAGATAHAEGGRLGASAA